MAKKKRIRPLALCVIWRDDSIFVAEGYDEVKQETFYRPLGGAIEFGEYGQQTIGRELQEEIQAAVNQIHYLGTLESIFSYNGQPGHEIALIYEAVFIDPDLYSWEEIDGYEDDELLFAARWMPLNFFREGKAPLYPAGLLDLLS